MFLRAKGRRLVQPVAGIASPQSRGNSRKIATAARAAVEVLENRLLLSNAAIASDSSNNPNGVNEASSFVLHLTPPVDDEDVGDAQWTINWGDNSTGNASGGDSTASHSYDNGPNNYNITATYTDYNNNTSNADGTVTAHVLDVTPHVELSDDAGNGAGGPTAAKATEASPFNLYYYSGDPGSDADDTPSKWVFSWGDGHTDTLNTTAAYGTQPHTYARPGTYTISGTVTENGVNYTTNWSVSVADAPPSLYVTRPPSVIEGQPYTINLQGYEPAGSSTQMRSWTINWDTSITDGSDSTTLLASSYPGSVFPATLSVSHVYPYDSAHAAPEISVYAKDDDTPAGQPGYAALLDNDSSFAGGHVVTDVNNNSSDQAFLPIVQPDGKVLVAGAAGSTLAVLRYLPDGTLDPSFHDARNISGVVLTAVANTASPRNCMALQPDGKILVVGSNPSNYGDDIIARYNADGSLDNTGFASGGLLHTNFATAIALQSNGSIIAYGNRTMKRFYADGSSDSTFGAGGSVATRSTESVNVIKIQADDSILLAGNEHRSNGENLFAVARYTASGQVDTGFGASGYATLEYLQFGRGFSSVATSIALDGSGNILLGGYVYNDPYGSGTSDFEIARFTSGGLLDHSFGKPSNPNDSSSTPLGYQTTDFSTDPNSPASDYCYGLGFLSNGTLVAAGYSTSPTNGTNFAVARYTTAGLLDTAYGSGGKVLAGIGVTTGSALGMAILPDDRVIVVGSATGNLSFSDFGLGTFLKDDRVYVTPDVANLTAAAGAGGTINLRWKLNLADADAIEVDRSIDGVNFSALTTQLAGSATTYSDSALPEVTNYYYRVRMHRTAGWSGYSNVAQCRTLPIVSNLALVGEDSQIDLAWTVNDPAHVVGYEIGQSTDGVNFQVRYNNWTGGTSFSEGLSEGKYYYRVRAVMDVPGTFSQFSNVAAGYILQTPQIIAVDTLTDGSAHVTWTATSSIANTVNIYASRDGGASYTLVGSAPALQDEGTASGLWAASNYQFYVTSAWNGGESQPSDFVYGTTAALNPPQMFNPFVLSGSSVRLSWSDRSSFETGYRVESSTDGTHFQLLATTGPNATTCDATNLLAGTTYTFRVAAMGNGGSTSTFSAVTYVTPPAPPTGLSATIPAPGTVQITWNPSVGAFSGYTLQRSIDNSTWTTIMPTRVANSFSDSIGDYDGIYYYHVRAEAGSRISDYSSPASILLPPLAPGHLTASVVSASQIHMVWTDNSSSEIGFSIDRSSDGSVWQTLGSVGSNVTTYDDTGLAQGTSYFYRVSAFNSTGSSSYAAAPPTTTDYNTPTVVAGASANPSPVTSVSTTLSVLGDVPGGSETQLIYSWSIASTPLNGSVTFSSNNSNSAKTTTATFTAVGQYRFNVAIESGPQTVSSSVTVTVNPTPKLKPSPPAAAVLLNGTQQFTATEVDQFDHPLQSQSGFMWTMVTGAGTITSNGLYSAPADAGLAIVRVTADGLSSDVQIAVNSGPYKVTITGRSYESGYDQSKSNGDLTVTKTDWIDAATPEDAVKQAISGTVTLNTIYDQGNSTLHFPDDLGSDYGFAILATNHEFAANKLTWDAAKASYTGAIGMWDGDSHAPRDWDFYWDIKVAPHPLQLLIDSNNDDGLDSPTIENTPKSEQDTADDPSLSGKVIAVNSSDKDGDGIPDFADGYSLYPDQPDSQTPPTADEGAGFVPMRLRLPAGVNAAQAQLQFSYDASEPNSNGVERDGSGTDSDPYVYKPLGGSLRLWAKDESQQRNPQDILDGGDWIRPDETFPASSLMSGQSVVLYVEAVRPSVSLADLRITCTLTDNGLTAADDNVKSVRLTAFDTQLDEASADGTSMVPATTAAYSNPSPRLTISYLTFSNVRPSADGSEIIGDVIVNGTVQSDVADVTAGTLGEINDVEVYLNGEVFPIGDADVSGQKVTNLNSFTNPYAFVSASNPNQPATFQATFPAVALQAGNNTITVSASDPVYGASGYATANEVINLSTDAPLVNGRPDYSNVQLTLDPFTAGDKSNGGTLHRYAYQVLAPTGTFDKIGSIETTGGHFGIVQRTDNKYYISQIGHDFKEPLAKTAKAAKLSNGQVRLSLKQDPTIADIGNGMSRITYVLEQREVSFFENLPVATYTDLGTYTVTVPTAHATAWVQYIKLLVDELKTLDDLAELQNDAAFLNFALRAVPFGTLAGDINDHTLGMSTIKSTAVDAMLVFSPMLLARPLRVGATAISTGVSAGERVAVAEYSSVLRGGTSDVATTFGGDAASASDGTFTNLGNPYIPKLPTAALSATSGDVTLSTAGDAISVNVGQFDGFWRRLGPLDLQPPPQSVAQNFVDGIGGITEEVVDPLSNQPYIDFWRVAGGTASDAGSWVTRIAPTSASEARASLALLPEWGNTATRLIRVRVPVGRVFYEGAAAPQGALPGLGNQIWLPQIDPSWYVYVEELPQ